MGYAVDRSGKKFVSVVNGYELRSVAHFNRRLVQPPDVYAKKDAVTGYGSDELQTYTEARDRWQPIHDGFMAMTGDEPVARFKLVPGYPDPWLILSESGRAYLCGASERRGAIYSADVIGKEIKPRSDWWETLEEATWIAVRDAYAELLASSIENVGTLAEFLAATQAALAEGDAVRLGGAGEPPHFRMFSFFRTDGKKLLNVESEDRGSVHPSIIATRLFAHEKPIPCSIVFDKKVDTSQSELTAAREVLSRYAEVYFNGLPR